MVPTEMLVIQQPLGKCMTDLQVSGLWPAMDKFKVNLLGKFHPCFVSMQAPLNYSSSIAAHALY